MRTKIGLIYDPVYLTHDTGFHVETAKRLEAIMSLLEETKLKDKLTLLQPRPATETELAEVHAREYIESIRTASATGRAIRVDPDTVISKGS